MVERVMELITGGGVFFDERDGEMTGVIGVHGMEPWYSTEPVITDCFIYVKPEARNLKVFAGLIREAKKFAKQWKCPLQICLYTLNNTERKVRLFEKYGRRIMHGYLFREVGGEFEIGGTR
jgi:GNAT superfamily N-acetyltransferase